jgi:hypothetical protein
MGAFYGATKGTRTLDPRITNALLYQLSHGGIFGGEMLEALTSHFHLDKCLMTLRGDADEAISFR